MSSKPLPTIVSVARLAGVSPSTVSRALRGHRLQSAETLERIQQIAARVGYHANPMLSELMRRVRRRGRLQHLGTIAYLTFHSSASAWRENATYREFFEGARRRAEEFGFRLELVWAREPHLDSRRLTQILVARGISAVLIGPRPDPNMSAMLDWPQFPATVIGMPLPDVALHRAGSYHMNSMERLLAAITARGYKRPGLALLDVQASPTDHGWAAAWLFYQRSLTAAQRVPMLVMTTQPEEAFARWYQRHNPDVVIGLEDNFVAWLERLGRKVPRDTGYARLSRPLHGDFPAGLHQFPASIGAAGVDLAINQIVANERGIPPVPRLQLIEGTWIDGWSVRPLGAKR